MHGYFSAEKFLVLGSTASQVISQRLFDSDFQIRPGSQVVRQRSAKSLYGGSIPPQASKNKPPPLSKESGHLSDTTK